MQVVNHTPYQAAAAPGLLPSGRYCVILVLKGTWQIAPDEAPLALAERQIAPHDADAFTAKPGDSSPLYENDFATLKPRCDVLVHRPVAHAPEGEPVPEVEVALRLGAIDKRVRVLGPRHWALKDDRLTPSDPAPFVTQALGWELAYGGVDETAYEDPTLSDAYLPNPIGIGYRRTPDSQRLDGTPIAQTEALDDPITRPEQRPLPQGLGPIGRHWHPRSQYAGTYDEDWVRNDKPFLPKDFDLRFCQCAPEDQQTDYPQGGEPVELANLTPEGRLHFALPSFDVPVRLHLANGDSEPLTLCIDTLTIAPGAGLLTLVARARYALKNSLHEIDHFVVGEPPEAEDDEEDFSDVWDDPQPEAQSDDATRSAPNNLTPLQRPPR